MTNGKWRTVALREVATFERSAIQPTAISQGTAYLGLEHIESGGRILGAKAVDVGELASSKFAFAKRHVLYGKLRPYLAKIALPDFTGICSTDILPILPGPNLERRFLCYCLRQPRMVDYANSRASGANLPRLSPSVLAEIRIPLPPLAEQRRLADVLDRAEALRAKRRAALAQCDSLTQSLFLDIFGDTVSNPKGWPIVPLPTTIYFQEGPGIRNWQFRSKGIKLVNVGNIVDGQLVTDNTGRYLDPIEVEKRYKHFLLDAGDFVVASSGVTWGKIAEVHAEHLPLCLNTSMIRFRPIHDGVEKQFVRGFVESPSFRRQIVRLITGSAQPNFGPAHLKQLRIALPPVRLQREFARQVREVEKLKILQRASLAELDALFASLQHRAFRGEL